MKTILKKDYVEFMAKLKKLVIDNLNISGIKEGETCKAFFCYSEIVGALKIFLDKYDAKYNNKVYYACVQFEDLKRTREAFEDNYFNANIDSYNGKMTFAAFEDEEEKRIMYNRFYDLIDAITDGGIIE